MKVVATGDWHLHNFKDFSKPVVVDYSSIYGFSESGVRAKDPLDEDWESGIVINSRLFFQACAIQQAFIFMSDNNLKVMLVAGDLFHERGGVDTVVFNTAFRLLKMASKRGITVVIIPGNHDQVSNADSPEHSLLALSALEQIKVVSEPTVLQLWYSKGIKLLEVVCVPFSKNKKKIMEFINWQISSHAPEWLGQTILMAHVGINGAYVGATSYANADEYSTADLRSDVWKYVVLGHYHKPQVLEDNAIYTGSIVQNNFNDEGDAHGFWVLDMNKRFDMCLVPSNAPEFVTVKSMEEYRKLYKDSDFNHNNFIRFRGTDEDFDNQDLYEAATSGELDDIRLEIERSYEAEHRSDISITQSWSDMVKTYAAETGADVSLGIDILQSVLEKGENE